MRKPVGVLINLQRNTVEIDNDTINFVTGDTGTCSFVFRVMLDDYNPLPSDNIVPRIMVVAPSGASLQDTCDVLNPATAEYGIVLKNVFITESGWHEIELQMFDKDTELIRATSPKFKYNARMSLQDDSTAQATNQFSQLQDLIIEVETALDRVSEETLEVVNNLVETVPGKALDAVQGKILKTGLDAVTLQSNEIASDVTNHKSEPIYKMISVTESALQTTSTTINLGFKPKLVQIHAEILGLEYDSYGTSDGVSQYSRYTRLLPNKNTTIQLSVGTIMFDEGTGANRIRGDVRLTDTGIVIDWTLTGSLPTVVAGVNRRYFITAFRHGGI